MAKFKPGDLAIIRRDCKAGEGTEKYVGTVVEIVRFEANIFKNGVRYDQGDWYSVLGEDGHDFLAREVVLERLPWIDFGECLRSVNYQPPPRREVYV